jgi:hypothetical protein
MLLLTNAHDLNLFAQARPGYSRKAIATKKKKGPNMPPGGRAGKRVRAPEVSQLEPPRAQLRSSKRLQLSARDGQPAEEDNEATAEQGNGAGAHDGNGASGQDIVAAESGADAQGMTHADEDIVAGEEVTEGKL